MGCRRLNGSHRSYSVWDTGQYGPLASTCLLTSGPIWTTGQCACGSKWNIEPIAKYLTINYTAFGCSNMSKFFDYQIVGDRVVLNLKK